MTAPRTAPREAPDLSRRDFLTRRLPGRVTALLGGGAATAPAAAEAAGTGTPGEVTARDLRRMSRDEVKAALARIRRQQRGSR